VIYTLNWLIVDLGLTNTMMILHLKGEIIGLDVTIIIVV
jgi:hypothetical protein